MARDENSDEMRMKVQRKQTLDIFFSFTPCAVESNSSADFWDVFVREKRFASIAWGGGGGGGRMY